MPANFDLKYRYHLILATAVDTIFTLVAYLELPVPVLLSAGSDYGYDLTHRSKREPKDTGTYIYISHKPIFSIFSPV